ncbi:MAG: hypothetical protein MUQ10_01475, partial [Anaerolineae bacterium]|nr:hypothetical protein [Anaerolineae bacterium]
KRLGDTRAEADVLIGTARCLLLSGELARAEFCIGQALPLVKTMNSDHLLMANCHWCYGRTLLCCGCWQDAIDAFLEAKPYMRSDAGFGYYLLGRGHLASGDNSLAAKYFQDALIARSLGSRTYEEPSRLPFPLVPRLLAGMEEACGQPSAFRAWYRGSRKDLSHLDMHIDAWYLTAAQTRPVGSSLLYASDTSALLSEWSWVDQFGDCRYIADEMVVINAANGRHLWHANLSAPRLLLPLPRGVPDVAVQVACEPELDDRPAIGGLLLWRDKRDYLWLEVGRFGKRDVAFGGCLDNKDLVIGRGRLPTGSEPAWVMGEEVTLRLELIGDRVDAFCSHDGEQWDTVGHTTFPIDDTVQVGVHAIGMIDRTIYHGAYPEGTAIRFTGFGIWGVPEMEASP